MNLIYSAALTALLAASPDGGTAPASPAPSPQPARLVNHVNNELCLETTVLGLLYEDVTVTPFVIPPMVQQQLNFNDFNDFNRDYFEVMLATVLTKKGYVVFDKPELNKNPTLPVLSAGYLDQVGSDTGTVIFSLRDSQKALHWSARGEYGKLLSEEDLEKIIPPPCSLLRSGVETEGKQVSYGYLRVNSQPFSVIFIDNHDTGLSTPVVKHRVPVGKHTVTLRNYRYRCEGTYNINIEANQTVVLVKMLECKDNK